MGGEAMNSTMDAEGCQFGKMIARQIKNLWAALTVVAALCAVQIALTLSAMSAAGSASDNSHQRAVDVARLDERLESIQYSISRIEKRLDGGGSYGD